MNIAASITLSRVDFLSLLADHFAARGTESFSAPRELEYLTLHQFEAKPINGTIFEEAQKLAQSVGLKTDGTFGGLSRVTDLTQYDAHTIGCACNGERVTGQVVAARILKLI